LGQASFVSTNILPGAFPLVRDRAAAGIFVDADDWRGVIRAAHDLCADIERVTGVKPGIIIGEQPRGRYAVIVGTLGKSKLIEQLVEHGKIDTRPIAGKWEASLIQVVKNPWAGVEAALVLAGSDKRGTVFAIYELSEQIGVSPWYWWADVPVKRKGAIFIEPVKRVLGPPRVKYRGIFINDEWPALGEWAREKFGGFNHKFYTNVFELILRLKGNFLWPAMWNSSFATDDPLNAKLADEYGIVVSTSHHEPMMRAWKEWSWAGNRPGSWDYSKNAEKIRQYWAEGLRRTKDYEKVITLGMRGDGDEPMSEEEDIELLQRIVADQRKLIADIISPDVTKVPQVWALYKEVQGYYERGMRVPDDVILLWCDDNWGIIRRLPTPSERKRPGGAGIYYHFDYVGGPRSYKWINTTPLSKIWEQMNLAYHYGATQIWVVNVGDIKPMEVPIEFFLTMAWDPEAWPKERVREFAQLWAAREFGPEFAADIADIVEKYAKYNSRRKPELLEPGTFSLLNYREADRVIAEWQTIADKAEKINAALPPDARDAFFQLVLYPAKACYVVNDLYVTVAKNRLYADQGRASANEYARRARRLFEKDAELTKLYHTIAGGKWNHMMSQTRIGYTSWQQPESNIMPAVVEIDVPGRGKLGVAIEGSAAVWPDSKEVPVLQFDVFNKPCRYIDVFNRGRAPFGYRIQVTQPWILVDQVSGKVEKEVRIWVSLDWDQVPIGRSTGQILVSGGAPEPVRISVVAFNPPKPRPETLTGFIEADGYVSIEA
ncbi:MAG: glycosyl hydrolase 115 family protein, partial [Verrucomicrobiales bacterium]|nr:glycosyl hydrolase 115 family protein [Verrucomicrobiales bacterium]